MKQWANWYAKLGAAIVDGGNPFSGAVNKIKPGGIVAKGPIGQRASGYSIVEAKDLDAALARQRGHLLGDLGVVDDPCLRHQERLYRPTVRLMLRNLGAGE